MSSAMSTCRSKNSKRKSQLLMNRPLINSLYGDNHLTMYQTEVDSTKNKAESIARRQSRIQNLLGGNRKKSIIIRKKKSVTKKSFAKKSISVEEPVKMQRKRFGRQSVAKLAATAWAQDDDDSEDLTETMTETCNDFDQDGEDDHHYIMTGEAKVNESNATIPPASPSSTQQLSLKEEAENLRRKLAHQELLAFGEECKREREVCHTDYHAAK